MTYSLPSNPYLSASSLLSPDHVSEWVAISSVCVKAGAQHRAVTATKMWHLVSTLYAALDIREISTAGHGGGCQSLCSCYPRVLSAAQFKISCHSSRQNLEIQGLSSDAGNFMLVVGKKRASLAAVSALSLPRMFTWLGIQHNSITLRAFMRLE